MRRYHDPKSERIRRRRKKLGASRGCDGEYIWKARGYKSEPYNYNKVNPLDCGTPGCGAVGCGYFKFPHTPTRREVEAELAFLEGIELLLATNTTRVLFAVRSSRHRALKMPY